MHAAYSNESSAGSRRLHLLEQDSLESKVIADRHVQADPKYIMKVELKFETYPPLSISTSFIGIAIGVTVAAVLLAVAVPTLVIVIVVLCRRRRRRRRNSHSEFAWCKLPLFVLTTRLPLV